MGEHTVTVNVCGRMVCVDTDEYGRMTVFMDGRISHVDTDEHGITEPVEITVLHAHNAENCCICDRNPLMHDEITGEVNCEATEVRAERMKRNAGKNLQLYGHRYVICGNYMCERTFDEQRNEEKAEMKRFEDFNRMQCAMRTTCRMARDIIVDFREKADAVPEATLVSLDDQFKKWKRTRLLDDKS